MKIVNKSFKNALSGDILYADFSHSSIFKFDPENPPIGIIIHLSPMKDMILVLALEDAPQPLVWSDGHILDAAFGEIQLLGTPSPIGHGMLLTSKIVKTAQNYDISVPAANYCLVYQTLGTQPGDWHLPGITDWQAVRRILPFVRASLRRANAIDLNREIPYWCSSEFTYEKAFIYAFGGKYYYRPYSAKTKETALYVRPMMLVKTQ